MPGHVKGSEAAQKTLGGVNSAVQGLAELRNQLGRGHGRTSASPALERHARLAFNTAVALTSSTTRCRTATKSRRPAGSPSPATTSGSSL